MTRSLERRRQRGFTLVEAVVVIVVLGVLSTVVAVFIRAPVQAYADAVGRAEVTDQADLALRRMARDIRLALPNSVRVTPDHTAIEFLQTKTGARYLSAEDGVDGAKVLDFQDSSKTDFIALRDMASLTPRAAVGDLVVVYNLGPGLAPADAYQYLKSGCVDCNVAAITAISQQLLPAIDSSNPLPLISLDRNPFARQSVPMPSPTQRFQVVSGPVSFYCGAQADGTLALWRAWGYDISANQNVPPINAKTALLARRLSRCDIFEYSTAATQRSGLVILNLELKARSASDPAIRLVHQVHVDNTP
jgi:MSHA biogenesis protein MshO